MQWSVIHANGLVDYVILAPLTEFDSFVHGIVVSITFIAT
jgi:hypothetical protein